MNEYKKFDYFETPIRHIDLFTNIVKPEQHGVNALEVYQYIYKMEEDRRLWQDKWRRYKDFDVLFLILFSLLIPIIAYIVKMLVCYLLDFYDDTFIDKKIISYFIFYQAIVIEFHMWNNLKFLNMYEKWVEKKHKKRSQFNRLIEEYLDLVNFEYCNNREKFDVFHSSFKKQR